MRNNIFLTSESYNVMHDIVKYIDVPQNKKLLFVDTAGEIKTGDRPWLTQAIDVLKELGFEVIEYTITDKTQNEIEEKLKDVDVLYVAGGDNFYLLKKAQENNFAQIAREFVANGGIYIGQSAGSVIAGPDIYPTYVVGRSKWSEKLDDFTGIGLVDFVILPHFGRENRREMYLEQRLPHAYGEKHKIIPLTDNQYVRVQEDGMYRIEEVDK